MPLSGSFSQAEPVSRKDYGPVGVRTFPRTVLVESVSQN
jgi:hypothetical protein